MRHAVLCRPAHNFLISRIILLCRPGKRVICTTVFIFSGPAGASAEQQHVASFLMLAQKIKARNIPHWIMRGNDDVIGCHHTSLCYHLISTDFDDLCVLPYIQLLTDMPDKCQR